MDNSTPGNSEILVRYLDGELSSSETDDLLVHLNSDPALQEELSNLQIAREATRQYGLRKQVSEVHRTMIKELSAPVRKNNLLPRIVRYSIGIAAGILLVIVGFMAYNFFTLTPEKVYSSRYQPYELSRVRDGETGKPIEKAFNARNYKEVQRIHKTGEDNSLKGEFLNGMASMSLGETGAAIISFNEVLALNSQLKNPILNDETEFYLALCYVRSGDFDLALPLLQKIHDDPAHTYHAKVTTRYIRQVKMLKWK